RRRRGQRDRRLARQAWRLSSARTTNAPGWWLAEQPADSSGGGGAHASGSGSAHGAAHAPSVHRSESQSSYASHAVPSAPGFAARSNVVAATAEIVAVPSRLRAAETSSDAILPNPTSRTSLPTSTGASSSGHAAAGAGSPSTISPTSFASVVPSNAGCVWAN